MCSMNEHWVSLLLNALQYAVVLHSIPALLIILISLKKIIIGDLSYLSQ